jgi:hypothetical protein
MARYIATVEYDAGEYWISFPGIQKAGSHAKRTEDIVPHALRFLDGWMGSLPASLDDAIADPKAPFEGTKLVIFEWEPSAEQRTRRAMSAEEIQEETNRILLEMRGGKAP